MQIEAADVAPNGADLGCLSDEKLVGQSHTLPTILASRTVLSPAFIWGAIDPDSIAELRHHR